MRAEYANRKKTHTFIEAKVVGGEISLHIVQALFSLNPSHTSLALCASAHTLWQFSEFLFIKFSTVVMKYKHALHSKTFLQTFYLHFCFAHSRAGVHGWEMPQRHCEVVISTS